MCGCGRYRRSMRKCVNAVKKEQQETKKRKQTIKESQVRRIEIIVTQRKVERKRNEKLTG